jgi:hypothetical protein
MQVLGYDQVAKTLNEKLLLLNIARVFHYESVHFTTTSSIAATFDWTTTIGAVGQVNKSSQSNFLNFSLGGSSSENPTFSIVPVAGEDFTKRIVTPFEDRLFEFLVFQGAPVDQVMRLMAGGVEVQTKEGRFVRFIENDPRRAEEHVEFRRLASSLEELNHARRLFVRSLVFEEKLIADFKAVPRAEDINNGFDKGLRWRQKPDGNYELTRLQAGRVLVSNFDPLTLSDQERWDLNEQIRKNPSGFVYLMLRGNKAEEPFFGAIKMRSMMQVLNFLARLMRYEATVDSNHAEPGAAAFGPRLALRINVTDAEPAETIPSIVYRGRYFSVNDTSWDRTSFTLLNILFQTTVGTVQSVGLPITIAK